MDAIPLSITPFLVMNKNNVGSANFFLDPDLSQCYLLHVGNAHMEVSE
jgi:hypothetical protein